MAFNRHDARILIGFISYLVSVDLLSIPKFIDILDIIEDSIIDNSSLLEILLSENLNDDR